MYFKTCSEALKSMPNIHTRKEGNFKQSPVWVFSVIKSSVLKQIQNSPCSGKSVLPVVV